LYKKIIDEGYILCIGTGLPIGIEITETEHQQITDALAQKPTREGYYYKLRDDTKTWDEFEIIPEPETDRQIEEVE